MLLNNKKNRFWQLMLNLLFIVMCVLILFPFILLLSVSFSSETDVAFHGYSVIPKNFDLTAYKYVFRNAGAVGNAYLVTFTFSVLTMIFCVLMTAMTAYPLTKKFFKGRTAVSFYLYFTMLFSGGLVPSYIITTQYLHLGDTLWVYVLPCLVSPWYIFMVRTFFADIPESLVESAYIDGASEYLVFWKIMIPLAKPALATIALFTFVGKWNDWYTSMLYINNPKLISLQYMLQKILTNAKVLQEMSATSSMLSAVQVPMETAKMATAVVVAGPALFVFPFFQKYFVKGMTVGSVKG